VKPLNDPTTTAGKQILSRTLVGLDQANKAKEKEYNSPLKQKIGNSSVS